MKLRFKLPFSSLLSSWKNETKSGFFLWELISERRNVVAGIVLIIGIALVSRAYVVAYQNGSGVVAKDFNKDASTFATYIEGKLLYSNEVMSALQTYFSVIGIPSHEVFKKFADYYLKRNTGIRAIAWAPRVVGSQRETFLKEARKRFPSFQILDLQEDGTFLPSSKNSEYYPVYYAEPEKEEANVLGFNLLSNKERKKSIEEARDSGKQIVTKPMEVLLANEKRSKGFILMVPIYQSNQALKNLEERRSKILGIIISVYKTKDFFEPAQAKETKKFNLILFDSNVPKKEKIIYSTENKSNELDGKHRIFYDRLINVGGKTWLLRLMPRQGYYVPIIAPLDVFFLCFAFVFVLLTSIYIWLMLKYYEENSKLVLQFITLLESTPHPQFVLGKDQKIIMMNHRAEDLLGYTRSQLIGKSLEVIFTKKINKKIKKLIDRILQYQKEEMSSIKFETVILQKNGTKIPTFVQIDPLIKTSQKSLFVCTFTDLSKVKDLEKSLKQTILYDTLTRLPNKIYFEEKLKKETEKLDHKHHSIFIINIDKFKSINESFGLSAGDTILKSIAERMKSSIHAQDTIARMSGDEFALLTSLPQNKQDAQIFAKHLLSFFKRPFQFGNKEIRLSVSIGIAFSSDPLKESKFLLNKAELAMYSVKHKGGNTYAFYKSGMETAHRKEFELELALNSAMEKKQLFLEYQPIYAVPQQKIVGFEALLRWNYPPLGLVPPSEFISLIEDKPLIKKIGKWVFETACRDYKKWDSQFKGYLSINLAAKQLEDNDYLKGLLDFCKKEKIPSNKIVLEITESTFIEPTRKSKSLMKIISLKGFPLAVDDFGTKYASLGRLVSFTPNYLKIDKSFVDGIGIKKMEEEIIISILSLAKKLNLKTIAEGVETKEQLDFLIRHKCPYIQGFYFSRSLSHKNVIKLLRKQELKG
ncbi:MAG TPA: EAL domain-containing protein [Alphaproteobacteria bacterium]|nr:EAL domain-containing protein [Alphaproteobacteria bacterium]